MEEEPFGLQEEGLQEEQEQDDSVRAVASSMVAAWGYDRENQQIEVFFNNGHEATYDCSPDEWEEAKQAVSPGRFVHEHFL